MDEMLIVYKTDNIMEMEEINTEINKLKCNNGVIIKNIPVPAVVGNLAGYATQFLMSDNFQSIKTMIEVGGIFWGIIKWLKENNKKFKVSKKLSKYLVLSKLKKDNNIAFNNCNNEEPVIWGPMLIEPINNGMLSEILMNSGFDASGDCAYLIAVAMPKAPGRIRTIWTIINVSGEIIATWATQTFAERVPDFFKNKNEKTQNK